MRRYKFGDKVVTKERFLKSHTDIEQLFMLGGAGIISDWFVSGRRHIYEVKFKLDGKSVWIAMPHRMLMKYKDEDI